MPSYLFNFFKRMLVSPGFIFLLVVAPILLAVFPDLYQGVSSSLSMFVLISALSISVAIISGWGSTLNSIKNSSIRVRLKTSGFSDKNIILYSLIPFAFLVIFGFLYLLTLGAIFYQSGLLTNEVLYNAIIPTSTAPNVAGTFYLGSVSWGPLIFGLFTSILISFSTAMVIISFTNSQSKYTAITWIYILTLYFFGGASTPPSIIRGPSSVAELRILSFFVPNSYTNFMMADAINTGYIFPSTVAPINFSYSAKDTVINLSASYSIIILFSSVWIANVRRWEI